MPEKVSEPKTEVKKEVEADHPIQNTEKGTNNLKNRIDLKKKNSESISKR